MKNQRLNDLMILGQMILLAGLMIEFLLRVENISIDLGNILINHVYWGLTATGFLLITVASYDFIGEILALFKTPRKKREDGPIFLAAGVGILGCLCFLAKIQASSTWLTLGAIGFTITIIYYKDLKAIHAVSWAFLTIALIIGLNKWVFLQAHTSSGKWLIAAMVMTFLASYISKAWMIKRERKRKKNKE